MVTRPLGQEDDPGRDVGVHDGAGRVGTPTMVSALAGAARWPVGFAAVALVRAGRGRHLGDGAAVDAGAVDAGAVDAATFGDTARVLRIASVSKVLTAYAALIAVEEGTVSLDDPAGPPGATLRHLLAHAAGYGFESDAPPIARPGARRVYSNRGIEEAAVHVARATGMPFAVYLREGVLAPLQMAHTELRGSPAFAVHSSVADLCRFAAELLAPRLVSRATLDDATRVHFPGLGGVLPGIGRLRPLDWGLGFELKAAKEPHWSGHVASPNSFGHFGGSGSFLLADPTRAAAVVCLTDRPFGAWALEAWPPLIDAALLAGDAVDARDAGAGDAGAGDAGAGDAGALDAARDR